VRGTDPAARRAAAGLGGGGGRAFSEYDDDMTCARSLLSG